MPGARRMSRGTRNVVAPGRGRTATSTGEAILALRVAPDSKRVGTARDTQKVGSDTALQLRTCGTVKPRQPAHTLRTSGGNEEAGRCQPPARRFEMDEVWLPT